MRDWGRWKRSTVSGMEADVAPGMRARARAVTPWTDGITKWSQRPLREVPAEVALHHTAPYVVINREGSEQHLHLTPGVSMRSSTLTSLCISAALLPASIFAQQGVTVQNMSDVRFQGALGAIVGMAAKLGGASTHDILSTSYVSGHRMRSESANTASIIDADAGRITSIDHKAKTFSSMTFAEMAAALQQATQSSQQNKTKAQAKDQKQTKDSVNVTYKVSVDRPGQREKIAGADAERVFITITMEGEATKDDGKTESVGNMVFLMDQWIAKDAPQMAAYREFERAYAQKAGREFRSQAEGMQAAFAGDPRIKDGFEAAAKELQKVPGVVLRSTTYVVGVPVGLTFDRPLALNEAATAAKTDSAAKKDDKPKGGLRGMMGAIKAAADEANKQPDKKDAAAKQGTLMTVTNTVKSVTMGAVADDLFAPPAGYREVKSTRP